MDKKIYILESSPDRKKWTLRARFMEGQDSRFGKPFDADVALLEAKSFKEHWKMQYRAYDRELVKEIHDRQYVRITIEI